MVKGVEMRKASPRLSFSSERRGRTRAGHIGYEGLVMEKDWVLKFGWFPQSQCSAEALRKRQMFD